MKTLRHDWLPLAATTLMVGASIYAWGRVPQRLPVHWGVNGEIDRYGGRFEALGLLPLIALLLYLLPFAFPRGEARNAPNAKLTRAVLGIVVLGLAPLHVGLVANHLGAELAVPRLAGFEVGIILMGVGNLLPKAQPSRWVGVRTPWTHASRESWYRSQRAGGWVMTLSGLAFLVTALATGSAVALSLVAGATLLATCGVVLYGYLVWRDDPMGDPSP